MRASVLCGKPERAGNVILGKRRLRGNVINVNKYLKGRCKEDGARQLSVLFSGKTRNKEIPSECQETLFHCESV